MISHNVLTMEAILEDFTTRAENLKAALRVRSTSMDPNIQTTITELERRVANCRYLIEQEQQAVEKAWELLSQLDATTASLIHMRDHIPKHLPRKPHPKTRPAVTEVMMGRPPAAGQASRDMEAEDDSLGEAGQSGGMVGAGGPRTLDGKRSVAQNIGQRMEDVENATVPPEHTETTEKKAKMVTAILPVTVAEFDTIPKYILGRMTRDKLNDLLSELSTLVRDKQTMIKMPHSRMDKTQRDVYWEHKRAMNEETKGKAFVTEKDIKDKHPWSASTFKLDPAGRSVVAILRHLGRVKEVRGGGHTRLVVL
ncbi:Spindle and kinetochore-associated protein 1 [Rhizophlyctis rosea]|uniref:Spindle and kinetochore-associated protein 1 n=1 Tax=Rhizophlyctis rosea TaxID=64517 RepID=A0AAD5S8B3_9FUNG|nr:Spindle and kinetochore-associated protein 1 [Rhizophlyctis rosea]